MIGLSVTTPPLKELFPIGSIYINVNTTNPGTIFGGTWELIKDKFLLCSGNTYSNGSTGGSASFNNSHSHDISRNKAYATIGNYSERIVFQSSSSFKWADEAGDMYTWTHTADEKLNSNHSHYADGQFIRVSGVTEDVTTSIPTLPPYLAVTVWKRIA